MTHGADAYARLEAESSARAPGSTHGTTPTGCASRSPRRAAAGRGRGRRPGSDRSTSSRARPSSTCPRLVMQLRAEGAVDLDAPAASYLDPSIIRGIHVLDGVDSSERITVRQLLAHTSGIADYFEQKRPDGPRRSATPSPTTSRGPFDDVLRITKEELRPQFAPGPRARRSTRTRTTSCSARSSRRSPARVRGGAQHADPRSARADGHLRRSRRRPGPAVRRGRGDARREDPGRHPPRDGVRPGRRRIVSTATDGIAFLEAFMTGRLFPSAYLDEMQQRWNRIFRPLEYGVGVMRFALPRYFSPLRPAPPMVGHSGASGPRSSTTCRRSTCTSPGHGQPGAEPQPAPTGSSRGSSCRATAPGAGDAGPGGRAVPGCPRRCLPVQVDRRAGPPITPPPRRPGRAPRARRTPRPPAAPRPRGGVVAQVREDRVRVGAQPRARVGTRA